MKKIEFVIFVIVCLTIFGVLSLSDKGPTTTPVAGNVEFYLDGHRMIKNMSTNVLTHHPTCQCFK